MVLLLGPQLAVLRAWEAGEANVRTGLARLNADERGSVTVEQAVVTGVLVVTAGFVMYLLYDKVVAKAESVDLNERPGGAQPLPEP